MKIIFVRHGETDWNLEKRIQGNEDIPLNKTGLLQAKTCKKFLSENYTWDKIYSSPLARALKTAKIIAGKENVNIWEDLKERNFGKAAGMKKKEILKKYKFDEIEGMEKEKEFSLRIEKIVNKIININESGNILIVTHGMLLKRILKYIFGIGISLPEKPLKNGGITVLRKKNNKFELVSKDFVYFEKNQINFPDR